MAEIYVHSSHKQDECAAGCVRPLLGSPVMAYVQGNPRLFPPLIFCYIDSSFVHVHLLQTDTMKSSLMLWLLAIILTIASAVYQRLTGPTYPLRGEVTLDGTAISYRMERSYSSSEDAPVFVEVPDTTLTGVVRWKHLGSDEAWFEVPMTLVARTLRADIPTQLPLTKLEYSVELTKDSSASAMIPPSGSIPIRFKGDVPPWVLIPHVIAMFLAMLFSTRAGLEVFAKEPVYTKLTYWTVGALVVGGFVFGMMMTYFAFDMLWTGFPVGNDVTDNKTLVALVAWLVPLMSLKRPAYLRWAVVFAALVMFGVFLIPHSV